MAKSRKKAGGEKYTAKGFYKLGIYYSKKAVSLEFDNGQQENINDNWTKAAKVFGYLCAQAMSKLLLPFVVAVAMFVAMRKKMSR